MELSIVILKLLLTGILNVLTVGVVGAATIGLGDYANKKVKLIGFSPK